MKPLEVLAAILLVIILGTLAALQWFIGLMAKN